MNQRLQSHFFWGPYSPLGALTGCALIVTASSRLAFAVVCAGAILWVYIFTGLVYFSAKDLMPARGKSVILLFLSSLISSLYLLLAGFINPLTVFGSWFFVILVPPCLIGSRVLPDLEDLEPGEALSRVFLEALSLGLLVIGFSLVREPLGFGSLSLPGGSGGIIELFAAKGEGFLPLNILPVSSGALLLLGYVIAVYRHFQRMNTGPGDDQ